MRIEKVAERLVTVSKNREVKPVNLARVIELVIRKTTEASPVGQEALKLVQNGMLRQALSRDLNIKRMRRPRVMQAANEAQPAVKRSPRKRAVAKKTA